MTEAPERIALRWETGAAVTNGPLMTHPEYTRWVRLDLAAARETELRAEVERLVQERNEARGMFNDIDLCHMGVAPCQTLIAAHEEIDRLRALLDEAREALKAFGDFDDLPTMAKRPDIFEQKVRQPILRTLAKIGGENG